MIMHGMIEHVCHVIRDGAPLPANIMPSTRDAESLLCEGWYTDEVINTIAKIVTAATPNPKVFYMEVLSFWSHFETAMHEATVKANMPDFLPSAEHEHRIRVITAPLRDTINHIQRYAELPQRSYYPCTKMSAGQNTVIFACNVCGCHWVTVAIFLDGKIVVDDSIPRGPRYHFSTMFFDVALPLFAKLIALRPGSDWDANAFDHTVVEHRSQHQQTNSSDCGPLTVTNILHSIRWEPFEARLCGLALRFAHVVILFQAVVGYATFFYDEFQLRPYDPPLNLHEPWTRRRASSIMDDRIVYATPEPNDPLAPLPPPTKMLIAGASVLDIQSFLWNLISANRSPVTLQHLVARISHEKPEWESHLYKGTRLFSILHASPHFNLQRDEKWTVTIGPRRIRALDSNHLHNVLSKRMSPAQRAHSIVQAVNRTYDVLIVAQRYSKTMQPDLHIANEIKEQWASTFSNTDITLEDCTTDLTRRTIRPKWSRYYLALSAQVPFLGGVDRRSVALGKQLDELQLSIASGSDASPHVAIALTSVDAISSDPLSWCMLRSRYPDLTFTVMLLVPDDNNHTPIQGHRTNTEACWSVFDVDLLASMYPPLPHEIRGFARASPATRTYQPHVMDAHQTFITLQMGSLRWRSQRTAVDIWRGTRRFKFIKMIKPIKPRVCFRCEGDRTSTKWRAEQLLDNYNEVGYLCSLCSNIL